MALRIEVVYALPQGEDAVKLELAPGSSALDAVRASGIAQRHPEIDLASPRLGVHGRVVPPHTRLVDGDRVEVYRRLAVDPKEARRRRARNRP